MSNYNSKLQSNNTDLQEVLQSLQNKAIGGAVIEPLEITKNGTYTASNGVDGYSPITVSVEPELQDKTVTPTKSVQSVTADSGYDGLDTVTVNAIPSNYIIPNGILSVTENGTHNVASYESVNVSVTNSGNGDELVDFLENEIVGEYTNTEITKLRTAVFCSCYSLTTAIFPACTSIGGYAFRDCSSLTTVSFPVCTIIGGYDAFANCSRLTIASFPKVTSIGSTAFYNCSRLTTVSFPKVTSIGDNAFDDCSSLTIASFPKVTSIGSTAFRYCSSLTIASFPACTSIGGSAFRYCYSLTTAIFPACTSIGGSAFRNCHNLLSLYLNAGGVCTLINSNAFSSTPIAGYTTSTSGVYGSIFVPASLVDAYKTATNWTYFADRIAAIEE